ncbi:MAG: hypothetical protein K2N25_05465 [Muribaculaceae bacterium]|nr:hypothetical protein [Muribaculaceae bacterium]
MNKAKDIDELIQKLAESLEIGERIRYDLGNLTYGELNQLNLSEYSEYLDMEELPDNIVDELQYWEIDHVKYLRWALDLPDSIDPPRTWMQLEWMADFANEQSLGDRFIRDVQRAFDSRHPFGAFKDVMYAYSLIDDWYRYREDCYRTYVHHELGLTIR